MRRYTVRFENGLWRLSVSGSRSKFYTSRAEAIEAGERWTQHVFKTEDDVCSECWQPWSAHYGDESACGLDSNERTTY